MVNLFLSLEMNAFKAAEEEMDSSDQHMERENRECRIETEEI
jgi:hypothetical protein